MFCKHMRIDFCSIFYIIVVEIQKRQCRNANMVVSGVISVLVGMDTFSWALCIGGVICLGAVVLSALPDRSAKTQTR